MNKTVIILAGPTAVGKTEISIKLARHFNTAIISADSRQCFKELNIGVAKPSDQELKLVPHYFINSHAITETVTAVDFEKYALNVVIELFTKSDVVVMAGGTGLYLQAFCNGLDEIPEVAENIRSEVLFNYQQHGINWLQQQIQLRDPAFYASGEMLNPQRLMRALEVIESTGKSITHFRKGVKKKRDFNIIKLFINLPLEELYSRINNRVDQMMANGLLEEVKALLPYRNLNALQTVGYTELFNFIDGNITLEEAIERIKINTRHYAKRQNTWFRKDPDFIHCNSNYEDVLSVINKNTP